MNLVSSKLVLTFGYLATPLTSYRTFGRTLTGGIIPGGAGGVACICAKRRVFVHFCVFFLFFPFCAFLCVFSCQNGLQKSRRFRIIVQRRFYAIPPLVVPPAFACHRQVGNGPENENGRKIAGAISGGPHQGRAPKSSKNSWANGWPDSWILAIFCLWGHVFADASHFASLFFCPFSVSGQFPTCNWSKELQITWSEPPTWDRQEGVTPPDLFRFPVFFLFVPIVFPCFAECADLFRFAPFSSGLFRFPFRTNHNKSGKPLSTDPFCKCLNWERKKTHANKNFMKLSRGLGVPKFCLCVFLPIRHDPKKHINKILAPT